MPAGVSTGSVTDFGAVLGAERSRADHRLASLRDELASVIEGSRWTTDDDEHDPEGSTIAFERAKIAALIADTESELRDIDAAESRLSTGTYGSCERCGGEIPAIRLEALPAARRCVHCVRLR
ncbi:TraR/DksA family transcriptional regulator [Rhodococcoides navarretei]|uniref:TraR/DksA C4-type zinc finger protein n=1 Tax=Rhodococcus navarretei TaxID=3128981 RepID=A0ABU9CYD3_9NOCA